MSDTNRNQVEEQKSKVSCVHRESSVTCWGIVQSKNHIKALSTIFVHIIIIPCTYSIHFNIANIYISDIFLKWILKFFGFSKS